MQSMAFNQKQKFMKVFNLQCHQHLSSTPTLVPHILNTIFGVFGVVLLFWRVEADVEVGAGDYRQLSGTWADLSGCGWPPLGKSGLRSGASDLLQALACLADELLAARAPCGDWLRPICSLPLKRTGLMC